MELTNTRDQNQHQNSTKIDRLPYSTTDDSAIAWTSTTSLASTVHTHATQHSTIPSSLLEPNTSAATTTLAIEKLSTHTPASSGSPSPNTSLSNRTLLSIGVVISIASPTILALVIWCVLRHRRHRIPRHTAAQDPPPCHTARPDNYTHNSSLKAAPTVVVRDVTSHTTPVIVSGQMKQVIQHRNDLQQHREAAQRVGHERVQRALSRPAVEISSTRPFPRLEAGGGKGTRSSERERKC